MQAPTQDAIAYYKPEDNVTLLEVFGSDASVVNAARVSYSKCNDEKAPLTDKDKNLIKYLAQHRHDSPFFHPQARFRIKMPIFVAREWFRHTVGFSRNEESRRYVDGAVQCFLPDTARQRDPNVKQGSMKSPVFLNELAIAQMQASMTTATSTYRNLLSIGVAPEVARTVLPVSMMTEFVETGSLMAYARLYKLRHHPAAQLEIQRYAEVVGKLLSAKFPVSWDALTA